MRYHPPHAAEKILDEEKVMPVYTVSPAPTGGSGQSICSGIVVFIIIVAILFYLLSPQTASAALSCYAQPQTPPNGGYKPQIVRNPHSLPAQAAPLDPTHTPQRPSPRRRAKLSSMTLFRDTDDATLTSDVAQALTSLHGSTGRYDGQTTSAWALDE